MKFYRIRHKVTGLFSRGTSSPKWSKNGKTWSSLKNLNQHLAMLEDAKQRFERGRGQWYRNHDAVWKNPYVDAEIVEYELTESDIREIKL